MSSHSPRILVYLALCGIVAVGLAGCVLKPGNNDSSSAPPSLLPTTTSPSDPLFTTPVTYMGNANVATVSFSHFTHVQQANQSCALCHPSPWNIASATGNASLLAGLRTIAMTMAEMYQGKYCGKCHNGVSAFSVKTGCSTCHANLPANGPDVVFNLANSGKVLFKHSSHVNSYKKTCNECHDTPWPMKSETGKHTMAQMYAGESCGKCHTGAVGQGFDLKLSQNCQKCHADSHEGISPSVISATNCVKCHQKIVEELNTPNPGKLFHARDFINGYSSSPSCAECHAHEAVTKGKAGATGVSSGFSNTTITCQTCHFTNETEQLAAGAKHDFRLRKASRELCATCHHLRYTYDPAFPEKVGFKAGDISTSNIPQYLMTMTYRIGTRTLPSLGDASLIASTTAAARSSSAAYLASVTQYLLTSAKSAPPTSDGLIHGGKYPHYSGQYDLLMGAEADTTVPFSKDLNGDPLAYPETNHKQFANACTECHMHRTAGSGKFGHTFLTTEEACKKCHTSGINKHDYMNQIENDDNHTGLLVDLGHELDADGNGQVKWGRSGEDQDLVKVMNSNVISSGSKLLFLGAAWNFQTIEEDRSKGIHNFKYAKALLENSLKIIKQIKARENITFPLP